MQIEPELKLDDILTILSEFVKSKQDCYFLHSWIMLSICDFYNSWLFSATCDFINNRFNEPNQQSMCYNKA